MPDFWVKKIFTGFVYYQEASFMMETLEARVLQPPEEAGPATQSRKASLIKVAILTSRYSHKFPLLYPY